MVKKRKIYGSGDEQLFYAVPDENNSSGTDELFFNNEY